MSTMPYVPPEGIQLTDLPDAIQSRINEALGKAAIHRFLKLSIDLLGPAYAVMSMPLESEALNGQGGLHGGVIATLIDIAAGTAAARSERYDDDQHALVTSDMHIRYLRTPRGKLVRVRADIIQAGRSLTIIECKVTDEEDRLIAYADVSSMAVPHRAPLFG